MKTYVFRVVPDIEEDVFRDIEIKAEQSFEDLHKAIIEAFDFKGDQMASFYMSNETWEKGEEIGLMDMGFGEEAGPKTMVSTTIDEMITESHQKILYLYDFLRMWIFYLELVDEKIAEKDKNYPRTIREIGISPEEEGKEIPGLLDNIDEDEADPNRNEIDDIFDEFGDDFDDEFGEFDNIDDYDL